MKKKILILLSVMILSSLVFSTSCNVYLYETKDNKTIYLEAIIPGMHSMKTKEIKKADIKTFSMLDRRGLAKDKNHLYYRGEIVKNIDGSTVEIVSKQNENTLAGTTAEHCFNPYVEEIKDKNGTYLIRDISAGMYELIE